MASIKKIKGKTGTSFKITATTGRDAQGKQKRFYKTFIPPEGLTAKQAEKAAKQAAAEFEKEIELGYHLSADQTFDQYAKYVIELKEKSGLETHSIDRMNRMMNDISPAFGFMKICDIRPQHLNQFYSELAKKKFCHFVVKMDLRGIIREKGFRLPDFAAQVGINRCTLQNICNGNKAKRSSAEKIAQEIGIPLEKLFNEVVISTISKSTIISYHSFIKNVFDRAEKEMLITYNPAQKAMCPKGERYTPQYFQPDELQRILKEMEDEPIRYKAIVYLLALTGCRRGEIAALCWSDIDFRSKQITISKSVKEDSTGVHIGPTKTRNTRIVKIPDEIVLLLREYRLWWNKEKLLMGELWDDTEQLFIEMNGTLPSPTFINTYLSRFAKKKGLPRINPHAFRHTAASIMISNGVDVLTVSKMLGHSNTSTTLDVYSHEIEEAKAKASECIADVILRKKTK